MDEGSSSLACGFGVRGDESLESSFGKVENILHTLYALAQERGLSVVSLEFFL